MTFNYRSDQTRGNRFLEGGTAEYRGGRLGFWERKIFPRHPSDIPFTVVSKYARRPDLLAFDLYGKASLQWVILQYNHISDLNIEFVEGANIVLPTKARLFTQLLAVS